MKTLQFLFTENSLQQVTLALCVAAGLLTALLFARRAIVSRLRSRSLTTATIWDDVASEALSSTKLPFLLALSVLAGSTQIELPASIAALPYKAMMLLLILQVGIWTTRAVSTWVRMRLALSLQDGDGAAVTNFGVIGFIARFAVWIVVLLLLLDNLGVNITTLVASLGIGGVAVALALQNILGDLFASLSIALDKPFVVGDFIIVDDLMGTVRHVGLKTTRIQSLSGEELIFSNNDLLGSRIRNYKRMAERRIVFQLGLTYDTPPEKLESLLTEARRLIEAEDGTRFDRVHFKSFGASSLDVEAVYYLLSADYNAFMDTQQRINLALLRYCNAQEISFAFPTQTIHIAKRAPANAAAS